MVKPLSDEMWPSDSLRQAIMWWLCMCLRIAEAEPIPWPRKLKNKAGLFFVTKRIVGKGWLFLSGSKSIEGMRLT